MSDRARFFTLAGSLLILSSCMVGPEYRRPVAPTPESFKEQLPSGWTEAQPGDGADRGKWWTIYNDPKLDELEEQVNISNQNVLAAEAQYREAKAAAREARSAQFPSVTSVPAATRL